MSRFAADLKSAYVSLRREPASTALIVAMLVVGIAGTTAVFSVYNALFLRPLPFDEPERLVSLDETAPEWDLEFVSIAYPDFHVWREQNQTFDVMAVWDAESVNVSLGGEAERLRAARASHELAAVLRIEPTLGRLFTPDDDRPRAPKVALLGYGLWQRRFGGDSRAVDSRILLNGEPHTIVGVLPPEAFFIGSSDLWVPLATSVDDNPGSWYLDGIGRLKAGVTADAARQDLTRIHKAMVETRSANRSTSPVVIPIVDRLLGEYRSGTTAMLAAVALVLLIACGNVAGLLLARAVARSREVAIRQALGASRLRIVRQLLTESVLLAAAGGGLGTLAGRWALAGLVASLPEQVPRWIAFDVDARITAFALLSAAGAALVFGLAPALQASRGDVQSALQSSSARASLSGRRQRSLRALAVLEVALALMLLTGYAGQVSLGHAGLLAAGAFTAGILYKEAQAPFWVTVPAAAVAGAMLGVVFGLPSLRLRGLYLAVSTLALHFLVVYLGGEYETKRGYSTGIVIDPPVIAGMAIRGGRLWYFILRTLYWDWTFREGEIHYQKYCGTPPEHLLFGLRKALDMLLAEGLEKAIRRHALLAEATRAAVAKWAEARALAFNIPNPADRANSITCILTPAHDPQPLLDYCRDKCGVVLGVGLGDLSGKGFRIAHMGHCNAPMVLGTLGATEMGLKALGIPHGSGGVQAAIDYLGCQVRP